MKRLYIVCMALFAIMASSCNNETDLFPLSEGSADLWYADETEVLMSISSLYKIGYWTMVPDDFTDDWFNRDAVTVVTGGTVTSDYWETNAYWTRAYQVITQANAILEAFEQQSVIDLLEPDVYAAYMAEARFVRAAQYGFLTFLYGDVVYCDSTMTIDEAFEMGRTSKEEVMEYIYEDFDYAIENLPTSYSSSETQRATKSAAYALKARYALYNDDYATAATAAKACMDLGQHSLHSDYENLFLQSTKNSSESIFVFPRSVTYSEVYPIKSQYFLPRCPGGWATHSPSWDLVASYLCTDGLPIDESPLYDPCNPFVNRDPRMAVTCTEVAKDYTVAYHGYEYDPNPYSTTITNYNTGAEVANNDTRSVATYASYNGLLWRKGIDDTWFDNSYQTEQDMIYIRLADVMLIYAEAKIEQNSIDSSVLDAMNQVRARAYGVDSSDTSSYPAITTTSQSELRSILRVERRMEFAFEELRYMDIIRWRIATDVLNRPNYGMLDSETLKTKVVDAGLWFFPGTPDIDENGTPDYSAMESAGLIQKFATRSFPDRQYLWPIPSTEVTINSNITQNSGY
ncbi:MAG: RagB/SusD family nutrient uptake outer membrane protein [Rikenellaceae bacterium]